MGDNAVIHTSNIAVGENTQSDRVDTEISTLPTQRQEFHFNYLNRLLTHSNVMFWVSVVFMILGGIIILSSGATVAFRNGGQGVKWVTGLSGALITTAGGILHRQARVKETQVTLEAGAVAEKINEDDRFDKATALIERIENPKLKDQLRTTAALTQLGLNPNADEMAKRLLPINETPEITTANIEQSTQESGNSQPGQA